MNFNFKKSAVLKSVKTEKIFIFSHAKLISKLFLAVFILSIFFDIVSVFSQYSLLSSVKISVLSASLCFIFWNLSLFSKYKLRLMDNLADVKLSDAVAKTDMYDMSDFLSFNACKIVEEAVKFSSKKKSFQTGCAALLYSMVKNGKDVKLICLRMGINARKLEDDIKNIFEKKQKNQENPEDFTDGFKEVMVEAGKVAVERGKSLIGEKEILVSLARLDELFKKVLIGYDLKPNDIENITLWLDSVENAIDQSKEFWTYKNLSKNGSLGKDWASGYTAILDQYSKDWRSIVSRWTYKEVIGNEKEIENAEISLAKDGMGNVLIVGDPGVGRKSVVQAIARRCYLQTGIPELYDKKVVELDMISLLSQTQSFEKLELMIDVIFQEVLLSGNVILVIDELHNFILNEKQKPGAEDISGVLSKYLVMPDFKFIGITTYDGLHEKIEKNSSFARFFRKIEISEVSEVETIRIVQNRALELEAKHKILILYPTIREIVNLSGKYIPSMPFPQKALDVLEEVSAYAVGRREKIVMPHHAAEVISSKTEIPVGKMEFKEKEVLLNLENLIHQRIVNQSEAVKEISIAMRRARAGISSKKRPIGSFLFLGPTGVGKTETSKALAEIYFGGEQKIIRIDMSEFQSVSDIPRLIGAVSPVEMQGLLTTPVRENPFSLILLDEIEKAHKNILNLFLQVFDEGYITDGHGRKVLFTNTIIISTSNAGAEMIFKEIESGRKLDKQKLLDTLIQDRVFKPEFINRFDATVVFSPLTKENLMQIAELSLRNLQKSLKDKDIDFRITEPLKEEIVRLSYKPEFGAREMRRVIQDKVENSVAEALLSDKIQKGDKIEIDSETFEVIVG